MWFTDFYVTQGNNHTSKIEYIYKDLNDFIYTDFRKSKKINRNFKFVSQRKILNNPKCKNKKLKKQKEKD